MGNYSQSRQILIHLAQTELALGTRARMALATPDYAAQSFDQNRWMEFEGGTSGFSATDALDAFVTIATMNRALFGSLSTAERATPCRIPNTAR